MKKTTTHIDIWLEKSTNAYITQTDLIPFNILSHPCKELITTVFLPKNTNLNKSYKLILKTEYK